jgi:hypothetical protein
MYLLILSVYLPTSSLLISAILKIGSTSFLKMDNEFADPPSGFKNTTTDFGLPSTGKEDNLFVTRGSVVAK